MKIKGQKKLTNSCNSRTLIIDIFGADIAHHLGGYSLKRETWREVRVENKTQRRPEENSELRAQTHIDASVPLSQRDTPAVVQDVPADVITNRGCS